jgi:hypothetical protein
MKLFKYVALATLATTILLLAGCGDTNNNTITNVTNGGITAKGTVTGVLTDAVTNEPLVGVTVYLADQQAVTGAGGQFSINDVPAQTAFKNESGLGPVSTDPYNVIIDMSSINSAINTFNADPANTVKKANYPAFAYTTVNASYQIVDPNASPGTFTNFSTGKVSNGFVANIAPKVGKLDGNIQIQVVDKNFQPVEGVSVRLFQDGTSSLDTTTAGGVNNTHNNVQTNSSSGNFAHLIQSSTSDSSGMVTFTNLEATKSFAVYGYKANMQGAMMVMAPADNQTTQYLNQQDIMTNPAIGGGGPSIGSDAINDALQILSEDDVKPVIIATTPANLSDIAPGATSVTFTFSEPINSDGYALALTDSGSQTAGGGLWKDIFVNFDGAKAGNIPAYTLAWNTDMTKLTVTLTTAPAGTYQVDLTNALNGTGTGKLVDTNKNPVAAPFANAKVAFSTSGGNTVVKPVLIRTNDITLDWAPIVNAFQYRVYVEEVVGGVSQGFIKVADTTDTHYVLATAGAFTFEGFTRNQIPVWYNVKVITMGTKNVESVGATSDPVKLSDTTTSRFTASTAPAGTWTGLIAGSQLVPGAASSTSNFTLILAYNEEMLRTSVQDPTKWGVSRAGATVPGGTYVVGANDIDPQIRSIVYTPKTTLTPAMATLTISVTNNAAGNGTWDPSHVVFTFSGSDVNANAISVTADQFDIAGGFF